MRNLIEIFLSRFLQEGGLEVVFASGKVSRFGTDQTVEPPRIEFRDRAAELQLLRNPELAFGELYMDGRIIVSRGSLYDVLAIASRNAMRADSPKFMQVLYKARVAVRGLWQNNDSVRARRNVSHHYDIGNELYSMFLDEDMQYSCAYFENATQTLDDAQLAKKRHIAAKLRLEPSNKVLDVGCGWGGMALYLARTAGADVTGITLSKEQLDVAEHRARAAGMANQARFYLQDYRDVTERFDRVVSVGMFEHVGVRYYAAYFKKLASILTDDGVALLHTIGRADVPGATNPWIQKYIFPGGYIPSLSEIMPPIEENGLIVTDVEVLRLHYAQTLRAWRERFASRRDEAKALYDERFCRLWEFYLGASECAFLYERHVVYQIQIAKRVDKLPLTRDYFTRAEAALRARDVSAGDIGVTDRDRPGLGLTGT
jgi:cyclopropane-fatty-acyl-phospholipid synthase